MKNRLPACHRQEKGFTIIELLIATMVFSVVLLMVTAGILQVSRVYYQGVTEATTQNTARSIIDTISQAIQFSGGAITSTVINPAPSSSYAFCVGDQQFSYQVGWEVMDNPDSSKQQQWHGLVQRTVAGCASSSPAQNLSNQAVSGRDLLAPRMRLANLVVSNVGANLYKVTVRVVYGDSDLLNNPTSPTANCKSFQAGQQFCAVSELSTVVQKRVE